MKSKPSDSRLVCFVSPRHESDFMSGHHIISNREHEWFGDRPADWSLLLTLSGEGTIRTGEEELSVARGDLILISPNHPQIYHTRGDWEIVWFHFLLRQHMADLTAWPEAIRGVGKVTFEGPQFEALTATLMEAHRLDLERSRGWYALACNLVENAIIRGIRLAGANSPDATNEISRAQQLLLNSGARYSIEEIAGMVGMSRTRLYTRFREIVGISPREFYELQLMRRAQLYLENTRIPISEIAREIGTDIYYFSRRFRKFSGVSPSEFRRKAASRRPF